VWVVIFKASLNDKLEGYQEMIEQLRQALEEQEGYVSMDSVCEHGTEITLSYWQDFQSIKRWGNHPLHRQAQTLGKEQWYQSYSVEYAELK